MAAGRRTGARDTRGEILAAARHEFAAQGYDKTSMRGIARAAGVDPALVHHYFDGKSALFAAAVDLPFQPDEELAAALEVPRSEVGGALVGFVVGVWDDPERQPSLLALLRSVATNEELATLMREGVTGAMISQVLEVMAVLPGRRAETTSLVLTQVVGLIMARYVLRAEPLASMSRADVSALVGPLVQRCLTEPS